MIPVDFSFIKNQTEASDASHIISVLIPIDIHMPFIMPLHIPEVFMKNVVVIIVRFSFLLYWISPVHNSYYNKVRKKVLIHVTLSLL